MCQRVRADLRVLCVQVLWKVPRAALPGLLGPKSPTWHEVRSPPPLPFLPLSLVEHSEAAGPWRALSLEEWAVDGELENERRLKCDAHAAKRRALKEVEPLKAQLQTVQKQSRKRLRLLKEAEAEASELRAQAFRVYM